MKSGALVSPPNLYPPWPLRYQPTSRRFWIAKKRSTGARQRERDMILFFPSPSPFFLYFALGLTTTTTTTFGTGAKFFKLIACIRLLKRLNKRVELNKIHHYFITWIICWLDQLRQKARPFNFLHNLMFSLYTDRFQLNKRFLTSLLWTET